MAQLDPCMSFGFHLKSQEDFKSFEEQVRRGITELNPNSLFHIIEEDDFSVSLSGSIISIASYL
jgi:hypothetical protein